MGKQDCQRPGFPPLQAFGDQMLADLGGPSSWSCLHRSLPLVHRHWVPPLKRLEPGRGTGPWPQGGHADKGFREEAAFGRGLCCPWGQLGPWWEAQLDASQQLVDKKLM